MTVHPLAATIETLVDAITAVVEALGRTLVPSRIDAVRSAIETLVDAIAALIETILDAITAVIETPLDPVAAAIGSIPGVRPDLSRTEQQSETEQKCAAFHGRPPWPKIRKLSVDNGRVRAPLTASL